jgi:hypothetical protein
MFCAEDPGEGRSGKGEGYEIRILAYKILMLLCTNYNYRLMTSIRTKPRSVEKVRMFIEIAKLRVSEGVIFEGKKIKEVLPWKN